MDLDSFGARSRLSVGDRSYDVFRLDAIVDDPRQLPYSIRVLVENLLRREDGTDVTADDIRAIADRSRSAQEAGRREIQFMPARVLDAGPHRRARDRRPRRAARRGRARSAATPATSSRVSRSTS